MIKMTAGDSNSSWIKFQEHGVTASYTQDAAIVATLKDLQIGTFVIVNQKQSLNTLVGIGVTTSEYREIPVNDRPDGLETYQHFIDVEWIHTETVKFDKDILPYNYHFINLSDEIAEEIISKYKSLGVDVDSNLYDETSDDFMEENEIAQLTKYTKNIILYGSPGTGKTYALQKFEQGFLRLNSDEQASIEENESADIRENARTEFVTFHPSIAYEEFVEGLRPEVKDGQISYTIRPGVFKRICERAEKELVAAAESSPPRTPHSFLIIIDEINRANIAKVFGELMTLIEDSKRITASGKGLRAILPYSGHKFGVPENLYIIGTMNTADRSIALLDVALRRRFTFLEMVPNSEIIRQTSGDDGTIGSIDVAVLFEGLNNHLRLVLDRDHQIGHSYLSDIQGGLEELYFRWYRKIIPLLQEYFYNDGAKLRAALGESFVKILNKSSNSLVRLDYDINLLSLHEFEIELSKLQDFYGK